jgi:hypothetical protein
MPFWCYAALLSLTLAAPVAIAEEAQTLKERLSDKASDAQRVDNCRVPMERRGAVPRPDCPRKPQPPLSQGETDRPPIRDNRITASARPEC